MNQLGKTNKELWEDFTTEGMQGASKKRINKLRCLFVRIDLKLKQPLSTATKKNIKQFIIELENDSILKKNGEPYSAESKSDFKKFFKQFYKWYKGDGMDYPDQVKWLSVKVPKDQKPEPKIAITKEQAERLANGFKKIELKIMTLILFDSGFRIDELLSMKKKDLFWSEYDEDKDGVKKCFWVKCNRSKTNIRIIPIPLFTSDVESFFNSSYYSGLEEDELIFKVPYRSYSIGLKRISGLLLHKHVTAHILRHSSATYYYGACHGDSKLMNDRYGWGYSSPMIGTYAKADKTYQKQASRYVFSNSNKEIELENKDLKERITKLEEEFSLMRGLVNPERLNELNQALSMIDK